MNENNVSAPKFSVIIPAYNAEKFIHLAVESVQNQSIDDWELIIVENGSEDNTTAVCEKFLNDGRVSLLHSKKGVSAARNTGIEAARGTWLVFLDADDQLLENALEKFGEIDHEYSPDLIIGEYENKGIRYNSERKLYQDDTLKNFLCTSLENPTQKCNTTAVAFRNSIVQHYAVTFDEQIRYAEDSVFFIEVLRYSKKVATIFYPVYRVVYNSQSAVRSGKRKLDKEYIAAINRLSTILEMSDPFIKNEWYIFILNQLLVIFVNDIFARRESVFMQLKDARRVMEIYEYKSAITKADVSKIQGLKKVVFRMMKMRFMIGIALAVRVRQYQNKKKEDKLDV